MGFAVKRRENEEKRSKMKRLQRKRMNTRQNRAYSMKYERLE